MSEQDNSQPVVEECLWDKRQTSRFARFSQRKLDYLMKSGLVPYVKIGRQVRFIPNDIRKFVASHRIG